MQIDIPEQIIRDVQSMLARQGSAPDVSAFVNRALQRAVFFDTVREIQQQNASVDPIELQTLIDEAIDVVRAQEN